MRLIRPLARRLPNPQAALPDAEVGDTRLSPAQLRRRAFAAEMVVAFAVIAGCYWLGLQP